MKYALFEFTTEMSCEVGETRWIKREDPTTFDNRNWEMDKEVMVAWPCEFSKVSRKTIKTSIDPDSVETTTCLDKVLRFSGKRIFICICNCLVKYHTYMYSVCIYRSLGQYVYKCFRF